MKYANNKYSQIIKVVTENNWEYENFEHYWYERARETLIDALTSQEPEKAHEFESIKSNEELFELMKNKYK